MKSPRLFAFAIANTHFTALEQIHERLTGGLLIGWLGGMGGAFLRENKAHEHETEAGGLDG